MEKAWLLPPQLILMQCANLQIKELVDIYDINKADVASLLPDFSQTNSDLPPRRVSVRYSSFDELKDDEKVLQSYDKTIPRSEENYQRYQRLRRDHPDMSTYVRENVIGNETFVFQPDEFPYDVPEDTEHYNLWIADSSTTPEAIVEYLQRVLTEFNLGVNDVVIIENPPEQVRHSSLAPSVPGVRHLHVFFRRKDCITGPYDESVEMFNRTFSVQTRVVNYNI